ncbi:SusC/RagA family TonB-linked outer membrane protein [Spirosoma sp. HMF4905]|uniref:SusC/RagA family TonB-linked outer membrane protein n=1 Tax=Spirosoma arboris TaxID=2682092 RepID=A0A7K1S671_9BACT|nr:TonB-dependent receptor [Spirosoma arboris]MVM29321.1 SusC/RagA family TonB-linked outer membrane protein [Spirosoma arboris]
MNKSLIFLLWVWVLTQPSSLFAQGTAPVINATLNGKVLDAKTKEPLIGATIQIKGITNGASTDANGKFTLKTAQTLPFTLIVTYVGYKTREVAAVSNTIDIELDENLGQLSEVVVVGYGTVKRSDITGSIASVPLEIKSQPVVSLERLLQGSIAGVTVTQTSGQPGGGVSVQVRGSNSITAGSDPLYVIDGFPINNDYGVSDAGVTDGPKINPLSSLNTADIESIDVLKDASATAIYGSRGANGVVIITTKGGSAKKSSISYDAYFGQQQVIRTLPLLNAREWWLLRKDAATNSGKTPTLPSVSGYTLDTTGAGTDWQAAGFRKAAQQSHSLSISSGSDKTRLGISFNYFKQDGVLQNTDFKRISARVNIDHNYSKNLRLSASITGSNTKANVAPAAIVGALILTPPALPVYQDNGTFVKNSPFETVYANPINSLMNQINQTSTNRFLGNFSAEYTFIEGLKAKVLVGADVVDNKQNRYLPISTYEGSALNGDALVGSIFTTNWLNENTLSYDKHFGGKHALNTVVGFTAQQSKTRGSVAEAAGFTSDALTFNNLGTGITNRTPGSSAIDWSLASYLGRINYVYDDRYLFTATFRADGSSKFGDGNKWGYFPSAAVGWNISNEKFFSEVRHVSSAKLRLSAGSTGNQNIPPYQSLAQLTYYPYNFSGATVSGYAPSTVANKNLSWEKTFQVDAGLDVGLLNERIHLTADYYYKKTTDLLLTRTVPGTSGLSDVYNGQGSTTYQNVGAVSNQGIELNINSRNITGPFKWTTILIYAKNTNKILSLGDGVDQYIPSSSAPSIAKVGHPLGSFIVYQTDGLIQQDTKPLTPQANNKPGGQQYKDLNGDGLITQAGDRIVIDNQIKFTAGLTNTFSYKGFDLSVFFQASVGGKLYNVNRANLELGTGYTNFSKVLLDRWTPTHTNTDVKAAYQDPAITISDRFIEDATYYRLKNASFGYTLPKAVSTRIGLQTLRVYVSAQNAATWTKYTGFDPEVSSSGQSLINRGVDDGVYPNNKSYLAGLSITF